MGVEPTYQPWEGRILPMNYTRMINYFTTLLKKIKIFFPEHDTYMKTAACKCRKNREKNPECWRFKLLTITMVGI